MERRTDLDGLRGIAILLTLILHYVTRAPYFRGVGSVPLNNLLDSLWSGVDLFFVLSGFLIGGIVLDSGRAPNFYRVFYLRRTLRIIPVALLTIAFCYWVVLPHAAPGLAKGHVPLYAYVLFINDFWTARGTPGFLPLTPMWSLAIEQQFYLVAPVLLLFASSRARIVGLIAIIVASPIVRCFDLGYSIWDFPLFRLDGLAAGVLAAALIRNQAFCRFVQHHTRPAATIVASLVGIALLFAMLSPANERQQLAGGIWFNSLAAAGVILYLHFRRTSRLSTFLSSRPLVVAGRFSYFIYLMHMPVLFLVYPAKSGQAGPQVALLAFAITVAAAWGSWRFLEAPLIAIGKRFGYRGEESPGGRESTQPGPASAAGKA